MIPIVLLLVRALASSPEHLEYSELPPPVPASDFPPGSLEAQGAYLYRVAGCVGCHSPPGEGSEHLRGGRDTPTVFGTFYAPNISPDPADGIGRWTYEDFVRAMQRGRSPTGRRYWPTFPFMAYTKMVDGDVAALWAYLRSQAPVKGRPAPNAPKATYKHLLPVWRLLAFKAGRYKPVTEQSEARNRGAYLVRAVGYCDQCHTPRTRAGLLKKRHDLAGGANPGKGEVHPNLTSDPEHGIGRWSVEDIARFLGEGVRPDGSVADPKMVMAEKVRDSYGYLTEADRKAIGVYLKTIPADDFDPYSHRW